MSAIPEDFIRRQVDVLLEIAGGMPCGTFRDAVLARADHYMDLVKAWRIHEEDRAASTSSEAAPK